MQHYAQPLISEALLPYLLSHKHSFLTCSLIALPSLPALSRVKAIGICSEQGLRISSGNNNTCVLVTIIIQELMNDLVFADFS